MTETVMLTSNPLHGQRRAGTVGLPLPGVELRLAASSTDGASDTDGAREIDVGEIDVGEIDVGEIEVRGPNVFAGYLDRREANLEAFTADGWFRTGDIGRIDTDGYICIVGRSKDLIITGGYNVYPRDVEEVLRRFPGIADVTVVGEPNAEWGETVTACVIAQSGIVIDPDAVIAYAAIHLATYQRPRRVVVVDEFPRNALGKVLKSVLQATL
jgi:malonyl-CoA/methylmalonyl-CoA synthetase